jgi:hypothetical protein
MPITTERLATLRTDSAGEGLELAIRLARDAVAAAQPDGDVRGTLRDAYSHDPAQLIATSHAVGVYFATVAAANDYWRGA